PAQALRPTRPVRAARPRRSLRPADTARRSNHSGTGRPGKPGAAFFLESHMKRVVAALLTGGMVASAAQAAPRAESALECGIAADMAVVAHSLAQEQVDRQRADAIMVRIYDVSESDRG